MEITIVRKFVSILAIIAFFTGMEQVVSSWPMKYQGTFSGTWLTFLGAISLIWILLQALSVVSSFFETKDRWVIQIISTGIWLVIVASVFIDATNHGAIPVNMTWDENIRIGMLFFLVPGLILSDLEYQFSQKK